MRKKEVWLVIDGGGAIKVPLELEDWVSECGLDLRLWGILKSAITGRDLEAFRRGVRWDPDDLAKERDLFKRVSAALGGKRRSVKTGRQSVAGRVAAGGSRVR